MGERERDLVIEIKLEKLPTYLRNLNNNQNISLLERQILEARGDKK